MSSDYYFRKWRETLKKLERVVDGDLEYQTTTDHDQKRCITAQRLSSTLGSYIAIYNDAMDVLQHNLQVQKEAHIADVIAAIVKRISEVKHQLCKLENSNVQFLNNGLLDAKLTTYDVELQDIPTKNERADDVQAMIEQVREKIEQDKLKAEEEKRQRLAEELQSNTEEIDQWWTVEEKEEVKVTSKALNAYTEELEEQPSETTLEKRKFLTLIGAQEKTRQVIVKYTHEKQKRELWKKELLGTLQPQAREELRQRAAELIQKISRAYFQIKRKRFADCKRDQLLGLNMCEKPKMEEKLKDQELKILRIEKKKEYEKEWRTQCEILKQRYKELRGDDITEDCRDEIRTWFLKWYNEALFFHDLPKENQGGSTLIVKDEIPEPTEWLKQYETYVIQKKANRNKTALERKAEKLEAKRERTMEKRQQQIKKKMETQLMKKAIKNPMLHPGFHYPLSNTTDDIIKSLQNYHRKWDELDLNGTIDVKEESVVAVDESDVLMEVKLEARKIADIDMREEQKLLKIALKKDYKANNQEMPQIIVKKAKRKGKKKSKTLKCKDVESKLEDLMLKGILIEYPKTRFEEFLGDSNFAGDDLRCIFIKPLQHPGETRQLWWDRCRELSLGNQKILLVGPKGSGKTKLVHIMATLNDAILFQLDPDQFDEETLSNLKQIVDYVATCARYVQPAVIYIKHVQKLFYKKVPPEDAKLNLKRLSNHLIRELFKKINSTDKVTIIGSCVEPWMTKIKILKRFPQVILLPNMSYSSTVQLLKDWVLSNHNIPEDFQVTTLAYKLQGYSYAFLKETLENMMTAERIIEIAANGISPEEVYEYVIENEGQTKLDYPEYLKWYTKYTNWGQREEKQIAEEKEFKRLAEEWTEKMKKKGKMSAAPSFASVKTDASKAY